MMTAEALPDAPSFQQTSQQSSQQPGTQQQPEEKHEETPQQETPEEKRERQRAESEKEVREEEHQRVAGVMPSFNVVMHSQAVPLTPKQKFSLVFHSIRDPYYFGISGIAAGFSEIDGSHRGYGWGASGYFKRFGAAYADNADGALLGNAVLPILWHQDPRYFRKGTGSIGSRILNAALSNFICRGDNGKQQVNYSNLAGNFIAGAISNAYYPADERGFALTMENGATVTAYGLLGAQLLEFGPDLNKIIHRKKKQPATPPPAPATQQP